MLNRKKATFFTLALLITMFSLSSLAEAATLHGSVYDIFLEELDKAIITIDTEPKQMAVSKNGEYSFNLNPGEYKISATYYGDDDTYELEEEIIISAEGDYNIDLILIPSLGSDLIDEGKEFEELDIGLEEEDSNLGIILVILAFLAIILYLHFSKSHFIKEIDETKLKSESEEELEKLIKFIKSENGRTTQKDIRKKFPSSEAKISLMITELEDKGLVKKIKKGRGNIIILTKEGMKK
jgi:uncharacterized membrane protein